MSKSPKEFVPLTVAVMTVSDIRNEQNDTSGDYLSDAVTAAGHQPTEQPICADNR